MMVSFPHLEGFEFELIFVVLDQASQASMLNELSARKAYERMQNMRSKSSYADTFGGQVVSDLGQQIQTSK